MKKVLYIITKSNWGGAQRYTYDLATNLGSEYEPVVALGGEGLLKKKLEENEVRTVPLTRLTRDVPMFKSPISLFNPVAVIRSVFHEIRVLFRMVSILKKEKPDILHVNSSKAGGLGALAGRLAGTKRIIFTAHGWYFNEDRSILIEAFAWFLSLLTQIFAHVTITVSEYDRVRSPLKSSVVTIHNGISDKNFLDKKEARAKLVIDYNIPETSFMVGTVAELHKNKGLPYLIEAIRTVKEATLIIFGDGEERKHLEALIEKHGLQKRIHLSGFVPRATRLLRAFDVFALSSIKEGLPFTILEAGRAGIPVIATKVGGIPEIIEHEINGILVPPKNTQKLAGALEVLKENPELRKQYAETLNQKVHAQFSFEEMLEKTKNLY